MLAARIDDLADRVTTAIHRDITYYQTAEHIPRDTTISVVRANFAEWVRAITDDNDFETTTARSTGASRAALGVPLPALMHAYRVGFQTLWQEFRSIAESDQTFSRRAVFAATERIWSGYDRFANEVADAHRDATNEQIRDDAAERAALTEHLLEGRFTSKTNLWETAALLQIPTRGPYLAVAAATEVIGRQPLHGVENKLRGLDLRSAWRLLPDQQIGLIHAPTPTAADAALQLLGRVTSGRVGVSAPFTELTHIGRALKYARISLAGPGRGVTQFDDSVLGIAAVATPEVSTGLAQSVLHKLYELAPPDRELLIDTFRAWVHADGNVGETADALFVHRNTIRHRLRRIETLTGRSTSSPRELAELCLAFEVDARLNVTD